MIQDHSVREETHCRHYMDYFFCVEFSKSSFIFTIPDRIAYTTAFVTPDHWLEREIAQWVHPMKDQSDDLSHHERTLLPRSYISLPNENKSKYRRWGLILVT